MEQPIHQGKPRRRIVSRRRDLRVSPGDRVAVSVHPRLEGGFFKRHDCIIRVRGREGRAQSGVLACAQSPWLHATPFGVILT
jgi:hypothetical protein